MEADRPTEQPLLKREVQAPERHPSGLGVMFLASAAMFFAVLGSAFIVRARMGGECPYHSRGAPPSFRPVMPAPTAAMVAPGALGDDATCGRANYVTHPDGTTSVEFRLCPGEAPLAPSE